MMNWIAKPYLNSNRALREFDDMESAVKYLEDYTGFKMDYVKDRKTKIKTYDWELVGKLQRVKS
jgi:hypothetical protein